MFTAQTGLAALSFSIGGYFMEPSVGLTRFRPTLLMFGFFSVGAVLQTVAMRGEQMAITHIVVLGFEAITALLLSVLLLNESASLCQGCRSGARAWRNRSVANGEIRSFNQRRKSTRRRLCASPSLVVEQPKTKREQGYYLNPELYGATAEQSIVHARFANSRHKKDTIEDARTALKQALKP